MNKIVSFDDEPLILVDHDGIAIGSQPKLKCHIGQGILHKAFSVFVFNSQDEVLLQRRSAGKMLWPSYWANSCCSHPRVDEDEFEAAHRRVSEELGISVHGLSKRFDFQYQARFKDIGSEWEHCSVFTAHSDDEVAINRNEVAETRWVAMSRLADLLTDETERFTPWIKLEWAKLWPMVQGG